MRKLFFFLLIAFSACHPDSKLGKDGLEMAGQIGRRPGFNQTVGFYADLQRDEGEYRFFVVDLRKGVILEQGLVLHGKEDAEGKPQYSNTPGSNCSSRGLAKVSSRYTGRFGKSYRLVGLEKTNSNMLRRAVVLHSWKGVPDVPIPFYPMVNSQGCPTVSPGFLKTLSKYIEGSRDPILLFIN